ncbi:MAG: DUF1614 domain-containing protein [Roseiarcus sp.]
MHLSHMHYLPIAPLFFAALVGVFALLLIVIQLRILRYAYTRLGVSSGTALLLLFASLVGSYVNIPVAQLPEPNVMFGQEVDFFGMRYILPVEGDWPGTIIAINVGGAVIPILLSVYLLTKNRLWAPGLVAILCVSAVCYWLATPIRGVGIALPLIAPPIAAAIVAMIVSWRNAAPLAYAGGSLGALIGADLLNLPKIQGLGAPVASIGGAGTFDGVFLTGVIAVLIASISGGRRA